MAISVGRILNHAVQIVILISNGEKSQFRWLSIIDGSVSGYSDCVTGLHGPLSLPYVSHRFKKSLAW